MDNETLDVGIFLKSLTAEQVEMCERDEDQLAAICREGLSEANAVRFQRAMLRARRAVPDATVGGVFEFALKLGLEGAARLVSAAKTTRGKKQRGVRVGVPGSGRGRGGVSIREA
jgi:hypothetical protein